MSKAGSVRGSLPLERGHFSKTSRLSATFACGPFFSDGSASDMYFYEAKLTPTVVLVLGWSFKISSKLRSPVHSCLEPLGRIKEPLIRNLKKKKCCRC